MATATATLPATATATLPATATATLPATATTTGEDWATTIARLHVAANRAVNVLKVGKTKVSAKDYPDNTPALNLAKANAESGYRAAILDASDTLRSLMPTDIKQADNARGARLQRTREGAKSTIGTLLIALQTERPQTSKQAKDQILAELITE